MKTTLKVFSIINIVLGSFCLLAGMGDSTGEAMVAGLWWIANGIVVLAYLKETKKYEETK